MNRGQAVSTLVREGGVDGLGQVGSADGDLVARRWICLRGEISPTACRLQDPPGSVGGPFSLYRLQFSKAYDKRSSMIQSGLVDGFESFFKHVNCNGAG